MLCSSVSVLVLCFCYSLCVMVHTRHYGGQQKVRTCTNGVQFGLVWRKPRSTGYATVNRQTTDPSVMAHTSCPTSRQSNRTGHVESPWLQHWEKYSMYVFVTHSLHDTQMIIDGMYLWWFLGRCVWIYLPHWLWWERAILIVLWFRQILFVIEMLSCKTLLIVTGRLWYVCSHFIVNLHIIGELWFSLLMQYEEILLEWVMC